MLRKIHLFAAGAMLLAAVSCGSRDSGGDNATGLRNSAPSSAAKTGRLARNAGVIVVDRPATDCESANYVTNRAPLQKESFIKLPVGDIQPGGWVRECLLRQRDGLGGRLGEVSKWLDKKDNVWLGGHGVGWEEVPYWLRGYGDLAYILGDGDMIAETQFWIENVLAGAKPDGSFGPVLYYKKDMTLWPNMPMLWCLQSYYEYSGDTRVIDLMTNYFKWQLTLPDDEILKDYWANSRGGDNLLSVLWLYNITGEDFLLELAGKLHRNTADWTNPSTLPNWHNVNIAQCFREPAEYYLMCGDSAMLRASYNAHNLIRRTFGQVPGGMFGGDENSRMGYIDPRQGVETCGMVEQMSSDEIMLRLCGDPLWAEHCEEVAFNSYPAALTADMRALRYITSPNLVVSDTKNHNPGINNKGPYLCMNPFSNRCCQHNHSFGWPYYAENLILATQDNGAAAAIYSACTARVKVADGRLITLTEETNYPFEEEIRLTMGTDEDVTFPLYLRVPTWTDGAKLSINGRNVKLGDARGKYIRIERTWSDGDRITLKVPMSLSMRTWQVNKNSVSVNYGPLTLSLRIEEEYVRRNSAETAIGEARWQDEVDTDQWPSYEIFPNSPWNYALVLPQSSPLSGLEVIRRDWPEDNYPFTLDATPLEVRAKGRLVPSWTLDDTGLCGVLPDEDAALASEADEITLVPMGAARLRISAFPRARE